MSLFKNEDGYLLAKLSRDGVSKRVTVHRLVALAFIPLPHECEDDLYEVNHIDCNRRNNCVQNLEWVTHAQNVRYAISLGRHVCTRDLRGNKNPNYGNHVLADRYRDNPDLAIQCLARPGSQNGRARPIIMISDDGIITKNFSYIRECCQWLYDQGYTSNKLDSIAGRITRCAKNGTGAYGFQYKIA